MMQCLCRAKTDNGTGRFFMKIKYSDIVSDGKNISRKSYQVIFIVTKRGGAVNLVYG